MASPSLGRGLLLLLLALGWGGVARASSLDDAVSTARAALQDGDHRRAEAALDDIESLALAEARVASAAQLGQALLLRGVALHRRGGRKQARGMAAWRAALVVAPDLEWDTALLGEGDDWSIFLALQGEVASRSRVDVGVPERTGAAVVHVDGVRVRAGDTVVEGRHLGQVTCDDGQVHSVWTGLAPPPDWLALCPGGVDTTVEVADDDDDDEWGDLAPSFGPPESATEDAPAAEPVVVTTLPAAAPSRSLQLGTPQVALLGAGGALIAGGTVLYFAGVVPSVDAAVAAAADPSSVTRADADALTSRARRSQVITLAALSGGVALAGGGLTWAVLLDTPVQPWMGPRMIGVRASF